MAGNAVNLLFGFDDGHARPFAAMLTSVRAGAPAAECPLNVVLIENFLSAPVRERIGQLIGRLPNTSLRWLSVDTDPIASAPLGMHFTRATYARILAFDALRDI